MVTKKPQKISSSKKVKAPVKRTYHRAKPELKLNVASSPKVASPVKKESLPMAPIRSTFGGAFVDDEIKDDGDFIVPKTEINSVPVTPVTPVTPVELVAVNQNPITSVDINQPIIGHPEDDIDSRQQFFKMMSEKIKESDPAKDVETVDNEMLKNKSVSLYRKIAIRFAIFAGIIALVVAYFCFTKLTISLDLNKEIVNDNLIFDVYGNDKPSDSVRGVKGAISRFESEESGIYQATGVSTSAAQFSGQVTLVNNYSKDQPLIASTRLLSVDNKLFRIKKTVNIKAGQSVVVDVYPDVSSADMAIASGRFTIPGLASSLQDKIYAESKTAFAFVGDSKKFIQQSDVDAAAADLNNKLLDKVRQSVGSPSGQYDSVLYSVAPAAMSVELTDSKVGDEKSEFTVKIKNAVNIISFSSTDIIKLAIEQKAAAQNKDKSLFEIDKSSLKFNVASYDSVTNIANVSADFVLGAASDNIALIDKTKIVNLNEAQLRSYLSTIKEIKGYDLKFFPSFIKRAPGLIDRISVVPR